MWKIRRKKKQHFSHFNNPLHIFHWNFNEISDLIITKSYVQTIFYLFQDASELTCRNMIVQRLVKIQSENRKFQFSKIVGPVLSSSIPKWSSGGIQPISISCIYVWIQSRVRRGFLKKKRRTKRKKRITKIAKKGREKKVEKRWRKGKGKPLDSP